MDVEAKICGLTRPEDAALAAHLGATRLGVVYAWGPRVVSRQQAREIVDAAGAVPVLGVFGDTPVEEILGTATDVGLRGVQLHRGWDAAAARRLHEVGLEVWRVLLLNADDPDVVPPLTDLGAADAVLIEARSGAHAGGQGHALPLDRARDVRRAYPTTRLMLAGGLTPETVGDAIRVVAPSGVDVSSGVESAPGIKDPVRLARFLEAVRVARSAA